MSQPLLTDLQPQKMKFSPGDRLLAKVSEDLTPDKEKALLKSIQKFAGEEVRVLIVNCTKFSMLLERLGKKATICHRTQAEATLTPGRMRLSCSAMHFELGDVLTVVCDPPMDNRVKALQIRDHISRWTGPDVEIRVI